MHLHGNQDHYVTKIGQMNGNKHKAVAQKLPPGKKNDWGERPLFKTSDLYRVPSELTQEIFLSLEL
jgi:hypothetical protein